MRKLFVQYFTGYPGEDHADVALVPDNWTDEQIYNTLWHAAVEHAQNWDHSDEYDEDEDYNEEEDLMWRVDVDWEDYDSEKHDDYRAGGGSFEEDFVR